MGPRISPSSTPILQSRDLVTSSAVSLTIKLACKTFSELIILFGTPKLTEFS